MMETDLYTHPKLGKLKSISSYSLTYPDIFSASLCPYGIIMMDIAIPDIDFKKTITVVAMTQWENMNLTRVSFRSIKNSHLFCCLFQRTTEIVMKRDWRAHPNSRQPAKKVQAGGDYVDA
jgi:hypothetical protein